MYRSRPRGKLDKDVLKFLSSMHEDDLLLYYDIIGSQAHVIMLHEIGYLKKSESKKILKVLDEIGKHSGVLHSGNEEFEDIHESVEAYLIGQVGIEIGGKMHTARSRNDQVVVDTRMKVRDAINEICWAVADLVESILLIAASVTETPMPMYTHLQQAQIGTFSHFLLSYSEGLFRDMDRLYSVYGRINQSPLGACAIGGSTFNIDRKRTADLLGFDTLMRNSLDAITSRDSLIEYLAVISILATTLGRIAEDFIIWSTSEFSYIELADGYSSSSSAMPQKKNPDPLELVRAKSAAALGGFVTALATIKGLPSGYSRDLQDLKPVLWQASTTTILSLKMITGIVKSLQINKGRMEEAASSSYAIAIDIAEQMAFRKQMPFRTAHKLVGSLVQKAADKNNLPLSMMSRSDVVSVLKQQNSNFDPQEILNIIKEMTPKKALALRTTAGSPNPKEEEEMIRLATRRLSAYRQGIHMRSHHVSEAFESLADLVQKYVAGSS